MGTKFKSQKKKKKKKKQKSKNVLNSSNQNCAIAVPHAHKWRMPPCLLFHYIAIASSVEGERDFDFKKKKTLPNQTKKFLSLQEKKERNRMDVFMSSCFQNCGHERVHMVPNCIFQVRDSLRHDVYHVHRFCVGC